MKNTMKYPVEKLNIGMYVSKLDIPICNTPFPVDGFYIKTRDEIKELSRYCNYVLICSAKSQFVKSFQSGLQLAVEPTDPSLNIPKAMRPRHHATIKRVDASHITQKNRKTKARKKAIGGFISKLLMIGSAAATVFIFYMQK